MSRALKPLRSLPVFFLFFALAFLAGASDSRSAAENDWPALIREKEEYLDRTRDVRARQDLAILHHNYAVALAEASRFDDAGDQMQKAFSCDAANPQLKETSAALYGQWAFDRFRKGDLSGAREKIEQAVAAKPDFADAYRLLGQIEYDTQRLKQARDAWRRALELNPALMDVQEKLGLLEKEIPVEADFERDSVGRFDLRYSESFELPRDYDIKEALDGARGEVGRDFKHFPAQKIVVIIYPPEKFRQLRSQAPDWAAGQFDGKIRVPLTSAVFDAEAVRTILYHEYTHAVIYQLVGTRCPVWFNEGLADYEAWKGRKRPMPNLSKAFKENRLLPWAELSPRFLSPDAAEAQLAYEESHSIVMYLIERYGFWHIPEIFKALNQGKSLEEAMSERFSIALERLERHWCEWLEGVLSHPLLGSQSEPIAKQS